MKRTIAGFVAGFVLGGAGIGIAATRTPPRQITVRPGAIVTFAGSIDAACSFAAYNSNYLDPGPVIFCDRASIRSRPTRGVVITRFHIGVTSELGNTMIHRYPRLP
jgi:hypothetical protein